MNFKKYYINGNRFTIQFAFRTEMHWNDFMYWLTRKTTPKAPISELIFKEMTKNPPSTLPPDTDTITPITMDVRAKMKQIRKNLLK